MSRDEGRKETLQHIERENQYPRRLANDSIDVRGTDVTASVLSYINTDPPFGDEQTERNCA